MPRKDVTLTSINMEWEDAFITSYYRELDAVNKHPKIIDWDTVQPLRKGGYTPKDAAIAYIKTKGE